MPSFRSGWERRWRSAHRSGVLGIDLAVLSAFDAAIAAAEDAENDKTTDGGGKANDEGFVVVDPGFDFVPNR